MTSREDDILAGWTDMPKVVAIGEIGLDYYWEKDAERRELQRRIFIRQLDLARELHMPVCIHDRDAHGDTLAILKKEGKGIRGVLHCYSGSYEMARELIKMLVHRRRRPADVQERSEVAGNRQGRADGTPAR